jgi:hypothetical protein
MEDYKLRDLRASHTLGWLVYFQGSKKRRSGARTWPRNGFLFRGAARRGPGAHPDSLGVPGVAHAREFSRGSTAHVGLRTDPLVLWYIK